MQNFSHDRIQAAQAAYIVAVVVELGGGLAILLGWRTRWVALGMAAYCLATAVIAHWHPNDGGQMINFWKNVAMAGGFLQLVAWGAGSFSLDRR